MGNVTINEIKDKSYGKCIEMSNGEIILTITLDFGPRIIRFGFCGMENELLEASSTTVDSKLGSWKLVGGHRFTHSPENVPRTYVPDNKPVKYEILENGIRVLQNLEEWTHIEKVMEVFMNVEKNEVTISHKLINKGPWSIELSVWSITAMALGGIEIIPLSSLDTGVLPNRKIVLWPYSNITDKRVNWLDKYIVIKQDPDNKEPFKLGTNNIDGWAAYINNGNMLIKRFKHSRDESYPDSGVSYETYINDNVIEMETLSPVTRLEYGSEAVHVETWSIEKGISLEGIDARSVDNLVKRYIG